MRRRKKRKLYFHELVGKCQSEGSNLPQEFNYINEKSNSTVKLLLETRDITLKSTALKQLLDIIEFLPDATFVIDNNKKVIAWNRGIEEMTGVSKEEIIGKGDDSYSVSFYGYPRPMLIDLAFSEDRQVKHRYKYFKKKGNTVFAENFVPSIFNGKGAFVWGIASPLYDVDGNLMGAIESIHDITDRKKVEDALRASEERFSKAFHANPASMTIVSTVSGIIIDANDGFLNLHGYHREEVIGHSVFDLNLWVDVENRTKIIRTIEKYGIIYSVEAKFRKKSGEILIGLFSGVLIDLNGEQCLLSILIDITERKLYEREMSRLDRLNLVGEMAAGIGHEIRNPMTTVRGFLQMLGEKQDCAKYREYFDLMIEELDRANSIITEFLSLAKNKAINLKLKNLNNIIDSMYPLIQVDALVTDKSINLELHDVHDLLLDEKEIRQLILNLVRNGLEAMYPNGKLTIKTYMDGDKVILALQDHGKGIDPNVLDKIGTPFLTTKDHGTGLGLAVCYRIANRHNASIDVDTCAAGTTFYVKFKTDN